MDPFRVKSYGPNRLFQPDVFTGQPDCCAVRLRSVPRINSSIPSEYKDLRPNGAPLAQLSKYTDALSARLKNLDHALSALGCPPKAA